MIITRPSAPRLSAVALAGVAHWPAARWALLMLPVAVAFYVYLIWHGQSAVLEGAAGDRAFWLHDDMMISMRYGRNLLRGDGLVWNPGQAPVEGYSNFGWVLLMAAAHLLPLRATQASLPLLLLSVALTGVILFQTAGLMARLNKGAGLAVPLALAAVAFNPDVARWTTLGLEVPLLTVVFLWTLGRILDEVNRGAPRLATYLLAGTLGLIRADGLVLAAVLALAGLALHRDRRRAALVSLALLALPALHLAFRLGYYGELWPNTYLLKLTGTAERLETGLAYAGRFLAHYGLFWLVAVAGALAGGDRRARVLWTSGLPLVAYAVWVGGDDFGGLRLLAPWLPVLFALAFLAPAWLGLGARPRLHAAALAGLLALLPLAAGLYLGRDPGDELAFLKAGLELEQLTTAGTTIGVFWAGALPYFADRPAVDLLGKNDRRVAQSAAHPESDKPGHNKFDYAYSLGVLQPELLVSPMAIQKAADPARRVALKQGDDAYAGLLFEDAVFRTAYAPTLVYAGRVPLFVREGSAAADLWPLCDEIADESLRGLGLRRFCRRAP